MNKEFVWTDEMVMEFVRYTYVEAPAFQGRYKDMEDFKLANSPAKENKRDWEVLKLRHTKNGGITFWSTGSHHTLEELECDGYEIFEVRRISDGVVFSVGDRVQDKYNNGEIIGFYIIAQETNRDSELAASISDEENIGKMAVAVGQKFPPNRLLSQLSKLPERTKLFTTEDGVDVFEHGNAWYVGCDWHVRNWFVQHEYDIPNQSTKTFSTKEKAKEYVALNKPCLSVSDLFALWCIENPARKQLIELAKSKL